MFKPKRQVIQSHMHYDLDDDNWHYYMLSFGFLRTQHEENVSGASRHGFLSPKR